MKRGISCAGEPKCTVGKPGVRHPATRQDRYVLDQHTGYDRRLGKVKAMTIGWSENVRSPGTAAYRSAPGSTDNAGGPSSITHPPPSILGELYPKLPPPQLPTTPAPSHKPTARVITNVIISRG
ncbi:hypothetical protein NMY22_g7886 [Coprinellus aureogranulatus]|nr:hypothetical protein NMY22_g7886 [Coprinellus aureogranulatus]